jgi:single-strand DNA-binding protein
MFAQITVVGKLGKDPMYKELPSGSKVANFSVAQNYGFGDNKGTLWHDASVWGAGAESFASLNKKGGLVLITGEPRAKKPYKKQDGTTVEGFEIFVKEWKKLSWEEAEAMGVDTSSNTTAGVDISDDDLPF